MTLPNQNEQIEELPFAVREVPANYMMSVPNEKKQLLDYVRKNRVITRKEAEKLLGAGSTKAFRLLKELCGSGQLEQRKKGRLSIYTVNDNDNIQ